MMNLLLLSLNIYIECIMRESDELGGIKGVEIEVMIKEDGNWKIFHIHYSNS